MLVGVFTMLCSAGPRVGGGGLIQSDARGRKMSTGPSLSSFANIYP